MRTHAIQNGVKEYIRSRETNSFKFIPNRQFYKATKIGQKRWGQIYRNEKPAKIDELQRLADYFGVNLKTFITLK